MLHKFVANKMEVKLIYQRTVKSTQRSISLNMFGYSLKFLLILNNSENKNQRQLDKITRKFIKYICNEVK